MLSPTLPQGTGNVTTDTEQVSTTSDDVSRLVDAWIRHFGYAPTTAREVLRRAIDEDSTLLDLLSRLVPTLQPHPLSRWLIERENLPLQSTDGEVYRFYKDSGAWRLRPSPALIAVAS